MSCCMATASVFPVGLSNTCIISPFLSYHPSFFKSLYGPVYLCPGNVHPPLGFGNVPMALCISKPPPILGMCKPVYEQLLYFLQN